MAVLDDLLEQTWTAAQGKRVFRYNVTNKGLQYKRLTGPFKFVAQFNENRGILRRKPQASSFLKMPFDDSLFNFTKVKGDEVLFTIRLVFLLVLKQKSTRVYGSTMLSAIHVTEVGYESLSEREFFLVYLASEKIRENCSPVSCL